MPDVDSTDYKLFTVPTVVMQNLIIEAPQPPLAVSPVLSDLCKLPKVHLENLQLGISPPAAETTRPALSKSIPRIRLERLQLKMESPPVLTPRAMLPKVTLEKLDCSIFRRGLTPTERRHNNEAGLTAFSKVPVVLLRRCDAPKPVRKRVTFSIPDAQPTYTIVGPYRHVPLRPCSVHLQRDDLERLKQCQQLEKPSFCKLCGKVYFSKKKLSYHQERKHDLVAPIVAEKKKRVSFSNEVIVHRMPYHRCRKCLKIFVTYKILKAHMRSQHRKRDRYICDYCQKLFADRTIFKLHVKLHCDGCYQFFTEKKELLLHRRTTCPVRKPRRIKCVECRETYFSNLALKEHSYSHMNEKKLICDICKEHLSTPCTLIRHLESHNTKRNGTIERLCSITKIGSRKVFKCLYCTETFHDEKDLIAHVQTDDKVNIVKYSCVDCHKQFDTQLRLVQHTCTHFSSGVQPASDATRETERPSVAICSDKQKNEVNVTEKINENGKKNLMNGTSVTTANSKPTRVLKNKKLYYCPICNKGFTQSSSVRRHSLVHARPVSTKSGDAMQCPRCEETFAWPALLRNHTCLRARHIEEVPILPAEGYPEPFSSFGHNRTHAVTTHIDFEVPAPHFEFAAVPEILPDVYTVSPAPAAHGFRYKVVRQEVPIEF